MFFTSFKNILTYFLPRFNKMNPKTTLSIQVPEELKLALSAKAEAEDINLSQFCRRVLKRHVEADRTPADPAPSGEQSKAA